MSSIESIPHSAGAGNATNGSISDGVFYVLAHFQSAMETSFNVMSTVSNLSPIASRASDK